MHDEQPPTWFVVVAAILFIGLPLAVGIIAVLALGDWLVW